MLTERSLDAGCLTCKLGDVGALAGAAAEITEVKLSGSGMRNLRHTRVALPKT